MFQKKTKSVAEAIQGVDARIIELEGKKQSKGKDIDEKKEAISKLLASLAMAENEKDAESLKLARKSLERLTENFNDLTEQLSMLQVSREGLQKELLEARLRDLPPLIEKEAEDFNSIFAEAVAAVEVLRAIQSRMLEKQDAFRSLSTEYDRSTRTLGIIEPLNLKTGPGELALIGGAFGGSFVIPPLDKPEVFVGAMIAYEAKLEGYRTFQIQNPDFEKNLQETHDKDSQPYEFRLLQNRKNFGSHRTIE